ncbi:hypothetical protein Tco_1273173 [Tanacetum coccineum]
MAPRGRHYEEPSRSWDSLFKLPRTSHLQSPNSTHQSHRTPTSNLRSQCPTAGHEVTKGSERPGQVARECTYPDFLKCQPFGDQERIEAVCCGILRLRAPIGGLPIIDDFKQ